jgi:16S rRNA (guanine1516-N2)-methyltransferase
MAAVRCFAVIFAAWRVSIAYSLGLPALPFYKGYQPVYSTTSASTAPRTSLLEQGRRVCVFQPDNEQHAHIAIRLSNELQVPLVSLDSFADFEIDFAFDHAIVVQPYDGLRTVAAESDAFALGIQPITAADIKRLRKRLSREISSSSFFAMKPVSIDFCPELTEQQSTRSGKDLLVQAVAPRKGHDPTKGATIYDLTAGFGQDALVLAKAGARAVTMVERDPIVYLLLNDACRRLGLIATHCPEEERRSIASDIRDKLRVVHADSTAVAQELVQSQCADGLPDTVYIDLMFPPRSKRASVKKNMQVLHKLLHSQDDTEDRAIEESALLRVAFSLAQSRVVCKRPLNALPVGLRDDRQPSYNVRGTTNRWDVYLI